jgi:hypothetical protein
MNMCASTFELRNAFRTYACRMLHNSWAAMERRRRITSSEGTGVKVLW